MISPTFIPSMACLLYSDLAVVIVLSVFARAAKHWLWYCASSAVISPSAHNSCFRSRVAISHSLVSDWIVLAVDTLPFNLLEKKHVFNGAIDVTNLCLALIDAFICLTELAWFLSTAPIPSLSSNLSGSMSTGHEGISRNRMTFLIKLCYPEPAVGTLPFAGHRCFNFSDVTYNTAFPFNGSFHHIWSAGRCIRKHLYD